MDKVNCSTCANCTGYACKEYGTAVAVAFVDCAGEGFEYYKKKESKCDSDK